MFIDILQDTDHVLFSVSIAFFRYEWSKFALIYLIFKSFLEVEGGCMGTLEIYDDDDNMMVSHKLKQPDCSFSL